MAGGDGRGRRGTRGLGARGEGRAGLGGAGRRARGARGSGARVFPNAHHDDIGQGTATESGPAPLCGALFKAQCERNGRFPAFVSRLERVVEPNIGRAAAVRFDTLFNVILMFNRQDLGRPKAPRATRHATGHAPLTSHAPRATRHAPRATPRATGHAPLTSHATSHRQGHARRGAGRDSLAGAKIERLTRPQA